MVPAAGARARLIARREEAVAHHVKPNGGPAEILLYVVTLPLACIPALVFTAWCRTKRYWACDVRGSRAIVPIGSRRARELRAGRGPYERAI